MRPNMSNLWPRVEPLLARVEKPGRYIGMERGSLRPEHHPQLTAWLLVYPDTYEVGLPNQGLQILYEILNERDDALAERAYAPWIDMADAMRADSVPLFSVDTHHHAGEFDVFAFGLAAELVYTSSAARPKANTSNSPAWCWVSTENRGTESARIASAMSIHGA